MSGRWKLIGAGVVVYAAIVCAFGIRMHPTRARAADEKKEAKKARADAPTKATPLYYGVAACNEKGCHGEAEPVVKAKDPFVCRLNEETLWKKYDKHGLAYRVIDTGDKDNKLADRARTMEKILAAAKGKPNYKVFTDPDCLACHAAVIDPKVKTFKFKIDEGVTCVVCHGAYEEWQIDHSFPTRREAFRKLTRSQKWTEKGMIDLWDPAKRTQVCASCHIGDLSNPKAKKFVTHEMYAAGHPPLPSFEVASFCNEMPRHWQNVRWKPKEIREIQKLDTPNPDTEQARLILVGAAVSLRMSMRLLEQQADACLKAEKDDKADDDAKVMDLSNFDCYACHHDLKTPSWRQKRGYGANKPGRIPTRPWPTETVRLGLLLLGDKKMTAEFAKKWKAVQLAFTSRPYGDPKKIKTAAKDLADWADELTKKLEKATIDKKAVASLLTGVPALYKGRELDFDSARVVGWSIEAIYNESIGYDPVEKKGTKSEHFDKLAEYLRLRLPSGVVPRDSRETKLEEELKKNLAAVNDYESAAFRKLFDALKVIGKK